MSRATERDTLAVRGVDRLGIETVLVVSLVSPPVRMSSVWISESNPPLARFVE
jgi:hypothetical protein